MSNTNFVEWVKDNYPAEIFAEFEILKGEFPTEDDVVLLEKALASVYQDEFQLEELQAGKNFNSDIDDWNST